MEHIKTQLLTFAHLAIVLALLVQLARVLTASLAQSLCITKLQRNSVFQLVIMVTIQLPLQFLFVQPVNRLVLLVLEALPINVFHAVAHCI